MNRSPIGFVAIGLSLLIVIPMAMAERSDWHRAVPFGFALFGAAFAFWALLRRFTYPELKAGALGSGLGVAIAVLALPSVYFVADSPAGRAILSLSLAVAGFVIGAGLGIEKEREESGETGGFGSAEGASTAKVCDTSVLIDGRLVEMAQAGFLEGPLIVPQFVLHELQGIADSSDQLKRNRGRRGLDVVERLQQIEGIETRVETTDFKEIEEVDHKLVRLASDLDGWLLTNDFNLNKVARAQKVRVLNINDLVNALKPIFLPGENRNVIITREGKENGQGIAYLDDGTMVVVDSGANFVGQEVSVTVTNIHQTTAGRMIFTKFDKLIRSGKENRSEKTA